jgi:adenylate cyclase
MWHAIDTVSDELKDQIDVPLRHRRARRLGLVGALSPPARLSLQFLGDTGNVAARLQALTKEFKCTMIVAQASATLQVVRTNARQQRCARKLTDNNR